VTRSQREPRRRARPRTRILRALVAARRRRPARRSGAADILPSSRKSAAGDRGRAPMDMYSAVDGGGRSPGPAHWWCRPIFTEMTCVSPEGASRLRRPRREAAVPAHRRLRARQQRRVCSPTRAPVLGFHEKIRRERAAVGNWPVMSASRWAGREEPGAERNDARRHGPRASSVAAARRH
jgi:hypothetical protein